MNRHDRLPVQGVDSTRSDQRGHAHEDADRFYVRTIANPGRAAARRAFEAMMQMTSIDVAAIEAAIRG